MTTNAPRQLRLIIETDDVDEALRFYRDVLGMPEQAAFATEGEDRVAILHAGTATLELASPAHARAIDKVENAPRAPTGRRSASPSRSRTPSGPSPLPASTAPSCSPLPPAPRSARSTPGSRGQRGGR